ncbi:MAG: hypothetical protein F4X72_01705 [Dehalococcoidia bacterium]|nr:hypothetical protein [Dehalococcoidia bacterium]
MKVWLESPGHKDNILRPRQRKVNIGLAWDRFNFMAVQQFEDDYIEYTVLPEINDGVLSMEGKVKNGANLEHGDHIRVSVLYNPPPQLAHTPLCNLAYRLRQALGLHTGLPDVPDVRGVVDATHTQGGRSNRFDATTTLHYG